MFHLNNNELLSSTVLQICDAAGEQGTKRNSMVVENTLVQKFKFLAQKMTD